MYVRETARTYPENKTSSNVRALEEVKMDMAWQKQTIRNLREAIEDYDSGWADDIEDNPRKRARMEQRLEAAKENYTKLKSEYESHPGYYADKYKDTSGFEKALTGILGSTIATVPVVAETTVAALKEAEKKGGAKDYTAALQAEEIAKNKMNDYANSYFGFYDMIDQDELDRLTQEYQKARDYRKRLETNYEQPVDMDSWGMDLMRESAWLKNGATENLDGFGKTVADFGIDLGQGIALSPLLLAGSGAYTAGVAANAAAEDMFKQTVEGKAPHEALVSGALTAGAEAAKWKIAKEMPKVSILNLKPDEKVTAKAVIREIKANGKGLMKNLVKRAGLEATEETSKYLLDFLVDKVARDPNAEISLSELASYAAKNKISDLSEKGAEKIFDLVEIAWNELD